jgi:hypothetical protein
MADITFSQRVLDVISSLGALLTLGETSTTAYRGDRGKTAYDHSQIITGNPHGTTATDVDALKRNGSNANSDIDIDIYSLNAKSIHVKGTGGSGYLGLKHQSSNITASASESAIGADSSGTPVWKNDGNPIQKIMIGDATTQIKINAIDQSFSSTEKSKLAGIENGATANSSNSILLNRSNHTGTQLSSTISDFSNSVLNISLGRTNLVYCWNLTNATAGIWENTTGAGAGTYTTALPTDTNVFTATKRSRYANVITTLNQVLGQRNTEALFFRGNGNTGSGGFKMFGRGGFDVWTNGGRFFFGMASATTVVSANPSLLNNTVGFAVDSTDNGLIYFITRDTTTTTRVSTDLTITSNAGFEMYIECLPNSSQYSWRIVNINTLAESSGIATSTLPVNNTKLTANFLASNGALTTATATHLSISGKIIIETNY